MPKPNRRKFIATAFLATFSSVPSVASAQPGVGTNEPLTADRWPSYRYDGSSSGAAANINLDFDEKQTESWSRNVDNPRDSGQSAWMSSPVRSNRIIIYTTDKAIIARGGASGRRLWSVNRPGSCDSQITPAVSDNTVVSAGDDLVTAWDLGSGQSKWENYNPDSKPSAPIKISNGTVYVGYSKGWFGGVSAIDVNSGAELWNTSVGSPKTGVVIGSNGVFTVGKRGDVHRIVNGSTQWKYDINGEVALTPILRDGNVVVPRIGKISDDDEYTVGLISVIDGKTGEQIGSDEYLPEHDYPPVKCDEGLIYSGIFGDLQLYHHDGDEKWDTHIQGISAAPILVDETLVVGTTEGAVEGYNVNNGNRQWQYNILQEEIGGVIAGRNAIFVTGKYRTVGGLFYAESLKARERVEGLLDAFVTSNEYEIDTKKARAELSRASEALYNANYRDAIEAVDNGESLLSENLINAVSTEEKIRNTRKSAVKLKKNSNYDPSQILSDLNRSSAELKQRNPRLAKRIADDAAAEISDVQAGYRNATTELSELNSTISEARGASIPLLDLAERIDESKKAFDQADFEYAAIVASETQSILQARIEHIESYRTHRDKMESTMVSAVDQDVQIGKARQTSQRANELFESENYKQAATEMERAVSQGRSTIETANQAATKIDEAETFDPIAPFVTSVAEGMGSAKSLKRAKDAYERGEYDRALNEANKAKEAQLGARFAIDGGVVTAIGGAAIARRYDALSKLSEYIAERTSEDEVEET